MPWLLPWMGGQPGQGSPDGGGGGLVSMLGMMLMIFAIFYFLLILPQRRAQKKRETMLSEVKKGDEVVTSGGILGTVVGFKNDAVVVKVDDQVKLKVQKTAITTVLNKAAG